MVSSTWVRIHPIPPDQCNSSHPSQWWTRTQHMRCAADTSAAGGICNLIIISSSPKLPERAHMLRSEGASSAGCIFSKSPDPHTRIPPATPPHPPGHALAHNTGHRPISTAGAPPHGHDATCHQPPASSAHSGLIDDDEGGGEGVSPSSVVQSLSEVRQRMMQQIEREGSSGAHGCVLHVSGPARLVRWSSVGKHRRHTGRGWLGGMAATGRRSRDDQSELCVMRDACIHVF